MVSCCGGPAVRARSHCGKQNAKPCVFMTVARKICIFEYFSVSHFQVNASSNELKRKRGSPRGEKIHPNVKGAKRELRNALQKSKFFDC